MKKTLLLFALLLPNLLIAQTRLAIKAGLNRASVNIKHNNSSLTGETSGRGGAFHITGLIDIPLHEPFFIRPALSLTQKGFSLYALQADNNNSYTHLIKSKYTYLEIPVNFVAKFNLGQGKFTIGLGPYISYGLSGTAKTTVITTPYNAGGQQNSSTTKNSEKVFSENGFKRLDAGMTSLLGYQFKKGLFLEIGSDKGLTNIANNNDARSIKNAVFSISIGRFFK
ncbi:MAG TPA: porin family protein [Pedobacter sp.]|jgi:hypothetical protein